MDRWESHLGVLAADNMLVGLGNSKLSSSKSREFIKKGNITIAAENRFAFSFDDVLVIAKSSKKGKYRYMYSIDMRECSYVEDNSANGFALVARSK